MAETRLIEEFDRARKRAVPLLVVETADPGASIKQLREKYKEEVPLIRWDSANAYEGLNAKGKEALVEAGAEGLSTADPPFEHIKKAANFRTGTILLIQNGHQYMGNGSLDHAAFAQSLWNLRDKYKAGGQKRQCVLMDYEAHLPEELRQDFVVIEDPLPTGEELWAIAEKLYIQLKIALPNEREKDRIIQTLKGLSIFSAEQAISLSLTHQGMDLTRLWRMKKKQIEQTAGLEIHQDLPTFADVRGADSLMEFLKMYVEGKKPPDGIVFMDELEKMFAGIEGDTSGTSQEQHGEFLRWMQNNRIPGLVMVGHPGTGKSHISKALAGEFKLPMIEMNVGAMKGSYIGETGKQTRAALKQILAIGRPLIMGTSNSLSIIPPEMKRRFKLGTWFLDLPTKEEKDAVWDLYEAKYGVAKQTRPDDTGWTQSEIEVCVDMTATLNGGTLLKSASYVTPISKSDPEKVERLRRVAHKRFNSAAHQGTYEYKEHAWMTKELEDREIDLSEFEGKKLAHA